MKIIVDTNLLVDFSRRSNSGKEIKNSLWLKLLRFCKREGNQLILPSLVVFEFFSGEEMNNKNNQEKAESLLRDLVILDLNKEIAEKAAIFFRKYKKTISVLDYFIAATAISVGGELATLNPKHFEIFDGLKLFDLNKLD